MDKRQTFFELFLSFFKKLVYFFEKISLIRSKFVILNNPSCELRVSSYQILQRRGTLQLSLFYTYSANSQLV